MEHRNIMWNDEPGRGRKITSTWAIQKLTAAICKGLSTHWSIVFTFSLEHHSSFFVLAKTLPWQFCIDCYFTLEIEKKRKARSTKIDAPLSSCVPPSRLNLRSLQCLVIHSQSSFSLCTSRPEIEPCWSCRCAAPARRTRTLKQKGYPDGHAKTRSGFKH